MKIRSLVAAATIGSMILLTQGAAGAAEIKVICAGGISPVVRELGAQFERATGHKLVMKFVSGPVVKREVEAGEAFDVAISVSDVIDDLMMTGKITADSRADIARAGVGVIVRAGAPKPDISSVDAFKRTLLNAKTVHHSKEGRSGVHFMELLQRLGITAEMNPSCGRVGSVADWRRSQEATQS